MAGTLKQIVPEDTIIFINSFDPDTRTITVNTVEGLGRRQTVIEAILCRPLNELGFCVPDRIMPEMLTGECNEIRGGLTDLTFGGLEYETCKKIEALPFFGTVYSAGISWKGSLNGSVTFILPQGADLVNRDLITFFIRQVAGFLSRRDAEEALKESDQFTKEIIHNTKEGIVVYDRYFTYLVWNPFMESLTGISASEARGKNAFDLFPNMREQKVDILLQRALQGETVRSSDIPYHVPETNKSGYVSGIYSPHFNGKGEIIGVIANIRDITDRKKGEEDLQTSRILMQSIFDAVPDLLIVIDRNYHIIYTNAKGHDLIHQGDPEKRKTCYGRFKLLDEPCEICSAHPVFETGKISEQEMVNPADGRIREIRAIPIKDMHGHVVYVIEYVRDITDRKRIEEALLESEEKYRIVAEGASDGIAILCDGRLEYANPCLAYMTGYTTEELTGGSFIRFISPESDVDLLSIMKKALSGKPAPFMVLTRIRHHDGHMIDIEISGTAIRWKGKKAVLGFIRNMSRRKKVAGGRGKKS